MEPCGTPHVRGAAAEESSPRYPENVMIFEINGNLEIGLKIDRSVGSRFGFLRGGWNVACFK